MQDDPLSPTLSIRLHKVLKDGGIDGGGHIYNRTYQILISADYTGIAARRVQRHERN